MSSKKKIDIKFSYLCIIKNMKLWNLVQANPDKPWNWAALSENPNITWEIVKVKS